MIINDYDIRRYYNSEHERIHIKLRYDFYNWFEQRIPNKQFDRYEYEHNMPSRIPKKMDEDLFYQAKKQAKELDMQRINASFGTYKEWIAIGIIAIAIIVII